MSNGEILDEVRNMVTSKDIGDQEALRLILRMNGEIYKALEETKQALTSAAVDRKNTQDDLNELKRTVTRLDETFRKFPPLVWMAINEPSRFFKIVIPVLALIIILFAIAYETGLTRLIGQLLPFIP